MGVGGIDFCERGLVGRGVIGLGSTETVACVVVGTECGSGNGSGGGGGGDKGEADACIDEEYVDDGTDVRVLFMVNRPRILKFGLCFLPFTECVGDVGVDFDVKAGMPSSSCVVPGSLKRSTSVRILCGLGYACDSLGFVCINLEGSWLLPYCVDRAR